MNDHPLAVLLDVAATRFPKLDLDIVRRCYEIQVASQFEHDRVEPTRRMQRLLDAAVAAQLSTPDAGVSR